MKKILAVIVGLALTVALLCGCGAKNTENSDKLSVICTIFPQYDFVKNIAGDKVDLKMLLPFGVESHDFDMQALSVADLKAVSNADVFIYVGGESDELWVNELEGSFKGEDSVWAALTDMTDGLFEATAKSMEESEEISEEYDEHVWTSPKRAASIIEKITDILCSKDQKNAEIYKTNSAAYSEKLDELDALFTDISLKKTTDTVVFADRFPFRYLFCDYGINFDAAFNGCSSVCDPSALQLESLCNTAESLNAKTVFYMENSKPVYAEMIAEKLGIKARRLHSCHTVTREERENGASYISLMRENAEALSEALI